MGMSIQPWGSLPSHFLFSLLCPPFPFPSLRSMARKIQLGGLGERCKLPQRGLGGTPVEVEFFSIFALQSGNS